MNRQQFLHYLSSNFASLVALQVWPDAKSEHIQHFVKDKNNSNSSDSKQSDSKQSEQSLGAPQGFSRGLNKHRAWLEVDTKTLAENITKIKQLLSSKTQLIAVLKDNAYGCGAVKVAEVASEVGVGALAVASLEEGIALRSANISLPILVFGGYITPEVARAMAEWKLQPTLCDLQQAIVFSQTMTEHGTFANVHLIIDTGLSRLGVSWRNTGEFVEAVNRLPNLRIISLYSHLATSEAPDVSYMEVQQTRFEQAVDQVRSRDIPIPLLHLANSGATLRRSALHYDFVRPGLALYGGTPPELNPSIKLKSIFALRARIVQVKEIEPNMCVSYDCTYVSQKEMKVAIVSIGYGDGIPRILSGILKVLVRDKLIRQIGLITMDFIILDATPIPDLQAGEIVTLIGQDRNQCITPTDWKNWYGIDPGAIATMLTAQVPRLYL